MDTQKRGAALRLILSLAALAGLSGCVAYGPPYGAYGAPVAAPYYPYAYGAPVYAGPPVSLNFGYYGNYYRGGGYRGHGWGGGGWGGGRGGYGGGWRGRR